MGDVRHQVFVSSTYIDLKPERQAVIQALLQLDCIPATMELFPASDDDQWTLIESVIDDCDYYIVIVGARYGSRDAEGMSFTEREYDYAVSRGIPVLGFVHGEPDAIPVGKTDQSDEARARLTSFRAKVQQKTCRSWTTADGLSGAITSSLVAERKRHPRPGWVRAGDASDPELVARLRENIASLETSLGKARTEPPPGAHRLQQDNDPYKIRYQLRRRDFEIPTTWKDVIKVAGPWLFGEISEAVFAGKLTAWIAAEAHASAYEVSLDDGSFQTIKTQLFALGIIQRSERKRTASDKQVYWVLTPYGETYVMQLCALTRPT